MRKAVEISQDVIYNSLGIKAKPKTQKLYEVKIFIDEKIIDEFLTLLKQEKISNKINLAFKLIIEDRYNNDIYGKEQINKKTANITAIKIKKKENIRIYCKEYIDETQNFKIKKVVLCEIIRKKTQKIDKKLKQTINKIANYEYEFY